MFLLYQKKDKAYPETIKIKDKLYEINADFRNILRIFDMLGDGNIPEFKKIEKLKHWFFEDNLSLPEDISPEIIVDGFIGFVRGQSPVGYADTPFQKGAFGDTDEAGHEYEYDNENETERQFCYNFDAGEIYAGFLCEYGIDLIYTDFLHWYKFKILLDNLSPESAFKKKIELRFMDLSGLPDTSELYKAKESVQLPEINNIKEIQEFNEIWGKAGNN